MSKENVDVYFAAKDRLAAGDHDGFTRLIHPDVTATVTNFPEPGPFLGRDALIAQLEGLAIEFHGHRYSDVEIIADRDDWIVLTYRWSVQGSRSGVGVDADIAVAFRVKDCQLIEVHWRESRDEALEAAGLGTKARSQENVDIVRRAHEAFNRVGLTSEPTHRVAADLLDPAIEWHDQRELPGATVHHGIEEVMRHLASAEESVHYDSADLLEILDAGSCVVAVYRIHARGRASGVPVERDAVHVYSFRGARIERVEIFGTRAEALAAAGLRE